MAWEDTTAPQFAGTPPTEAERIANGGRVKQEVPTGPPMPPAPLQSDCPD